MYKRIAFFVLLVLIPSTSLIYSMEKGPKNIFQQVVLKNEQKEFSYGVNTTQKKLEELYKGTGRMSLYELTLKCQDNNYAINTHSAEELKEKGLITKDCQPIGDVRNVVLSAVKFNDPQKPDAFNMSLQSPIKGQEESIGALTPIPLRNGSTVLHAALKDTMKSLKKIKDSHPKALRELTQKCRNMNLRFSSDIEDKLKASGF